MDKTGVVCLVGAGPGDSGLITEKGLQRLRSCDAVVMTFWLLSGFWKKYRRGAGKSTWESRRGAIP